MDIQISTDSITRDHDIIRRWIEDRNGQPVAVAKTLVKDPGVALLKIEFESTVKADDVVNISWDEFFRLFEKCRLSFLYQDETTQGRPSTFCKLVFAQVSSTSQAEHS